MMQLVYVFLLYLVIVFSVCADLQHLCAPKDSAHVLASWFHSKKWDQSECPGVPYLKAFYVEDPSPQKLFVNIGFNKGVNFAEYAQYWQPWSEMGIRDWHSAISHVSGQNEPIMCRDVDTLIDYKAAPTFKLTKKGGEVGGGEETGVSSELARIRPHMIGIDLNPTAIKFVRQVLGRLDTLKGTHNNTGSVSPHMSGISESGRDNVHGHLSSFLKLKLVFAAASNVHDGSIKVMKCDTTFEGCKIIKNAEPRHTIDAPLISVDKLTGEVGGDAQHRSASTFYNSLHYPVIDILHVDTEGNDALVIQGAARTLKKKGVRVLVFEYHGNCPWPLITLEKTIEDLGALGYDCYFLGKQKLWPLTGCWDPLYEFFRWSNVICARQTDVKGVKDTWHATLQRIAVTPEEATAALQRKQFRLDEKVEANITQLQAMCRL